MFNREKFEACLFTDGCDLEIVVGEKFIDVESLEIFDDYIKITVFDDVECYKYKYEDIDEVYLHDDGISIFSTFANGETINYMEIDEEVI